MQLSQEPLASPQSFPGRKLAPSGGTPCLKLPRWQREEAELESSSQFPVSAMSPFKASGCAGYRHDTATTLGFVLGVQSSTLLSCSLCDFVEES